MKSTLSPNILILAAGQGKRMRSPLPKVVHPVLFRPMIQYVLDLTLVIPHARVGVVVGHGAKEVVAACKGFGNVEFFVQEQPRGTADAVRSAKDFLQAQGQLLVLSGDVILLRPQTIVSLLQTHTESGASTTILTAEPESPKGYGRILRDTENKVFAIREDLDCSPQEALVREVNAGVYCFDQGRLAQSLSQIESSNQQGEYYLTDVIESQVSAGERVETSPVQDAAEMTGINDPHALSVVEDLVRRQINTSWMLNGTAMMNPQTICVDSRTRFGEGVRLEQGVILINSVLGNGVHVEAFSRIENSTLQDGAHVRQGSYLTDCQVGKETVVGPYAHLRPGTELGDSVKIGNFVEIKKSRMGSGSKASHLSYIGDAEVGKDVNIGCGFVTCNFDGFEKHKTVIEDEVFIGSDSQAVAPVTIHKGAYVASGTTITQDVPEDALALSRTPQTVKEGYASRRRAAKSRRSV